MPENVFWLDLEKITLLGHQDHVSDETVDAIIRGIEVGDDFDPVMVYPVRLGDHTFDPKLIQPNYVGDVYCVAIVIARGQRDLEGGHHRAVGHYIARKPLKCTFDTAGFIRVFSNDPTPWRDIRDIELWDDKTLVIDGRTEYQRRKERYPKYR